MATPDVVKVDPPLAWRPDPDEFLFVVWVREGDGEPEPFNVVVSGTQAAVAGFDQEQGPTVEWVRERFARYASKRLHNSRSMIAQMNEWSMPVVLSADA